MPGTSPGTFDAMRRTSMNTAVDRTWTYVRNRAVAVHDSGLDTGAAVWSARWALEGSLANRGRTHQTESDWLAPGELWFDAVQMSTILSYVSPVTIPHEPRSS
jgi:hypothetical protein